jgi:hypothetical protein
MLMDMLDSLRIDRSIGFELPRAQEATRKRPQGRTYYVVDLEQMIVVYYSVEYTFYARRGGGVLHSEHTPPDTGERSPDRLEFFAIARAHPTVNLA